MLAQRENNPAFINDRRKIFNPKGTIIKFSLLLDENLNHFQCVQKVQMSNCKMSV